MGHLPGGLQRAYRFVTETTTCALTHRNETSSCGVRIAPGPGTGPKGWPKMTIAPPKPATLGGDRGFAITVGGRLGSAMPVGKSDDVVEIVDAQDAIDVGDQSGQKVASSPSPASWPTRPTLTAQAARRRSGRTGWPSWQTDTAGKGFHGPTARLPPPLRSMQGEPSVVVRTRSGQVEAGR